MRLSRALAVAAADLYHQSWRLVALNVSLGVLVLGVVLASLAVRPALVLAVLVGPAVLAVMHCAVTLAQTEDLRLVEALVGVRRLWRRGLALGVLLGAAGVVGVVAVPFYLARGAWAWPLAAACVYLLIAFGVFQLALWPLAVFEPARPFRELLRSAALAVARRPFGFIALAATLAVVNVVGVAAAVVPFLTLTIAYSFLVAAHFALPKNPSREV